MYNSSVKLKFLIFTGVAHGKKTSIVKPSMVRENNRLDPSCDISLLL